MRPNITHGDVDLTQVLGVCPAEGWVAAYSSGEQRPVVFWLLLKDGALVGLVGDSLTGKEIITSELRAADKLQNFSNYLR
jgi:hypothetical protein